MVDKRNSRLSLLLLGILSLGFAIVQLRSIWTFKSQLTAIGGPLLSAETYVTTVRDSKGHTSRKSELIFFIAGHAQSYALRRNIGDAYRDMEWEQMQRRLKRADSVFVWIRKTELQAEEPEVFQVAADKQILLSMEEQQSTKKPVAIFFFAGGVGCVAWLWFSRTGRKTKPI